LKLGPKGGPGIIESVQEDVKTSTSNQTNWAREGGGEKQEGCGGLGGISGSGTSRGVKK